MLYILHLLIKRALFGTPNSLDGWDPKGWIRLGKLVNSELKLNKKEWVCY